jgi:CheY-like chemotaxis protein
MPRIDGIDLLHRIRQTAGLETLPVILCTGAADHSTLERAAQLSANHYIVKPFTASVVWSKPEAIETDLLAHQEIEDPAKVCARLRIDTGPLVGALLTELHDWATATRAVSVSGRFDRMALRANSLKGASANLGLRDLAASLGQAEARLEAVAANELPLRFVLAEADLLPLLDQVNHSAALVRLTLKVAA